MSSIFLIGIVILVILLKNEKKRKIASEIMLEMLPKENTSTIKQILKLERGRVNLKISQLIVKV